MKVKRLYETVSNMLRREAKPSAAAVAAAAEAERLREAENVINVREAILRREQAAFRDQQSAFKDQQSVAHLPSTTPWTQQDQNNLKAFLLSASGQRFVRKCRELEYANAIIACDESQGNTVHAAGQAFGVRNAVCYITGELAVNFDKPQATEPILEAQRQVDETVEEFVGRVSP